MSTTTIHIFLRKTEENILYMYRHSRCAVVAKKKHTYVCFPLSATLILSICTSEIGKGNRGECPGASASLKVKRHNPRIYEMVGTLMRKLGHGPIT